MRKGGSKQKGSAFEREIAEKLSRWVSNGEKEDCFWRSATSGGRATVARKRGRLLQSQTGDLSAIHSLGEPFLNQFYLELKFYRDLNYTGIITGKGYLIEFWNNTVKEAASYKKHPILIAKQNRVPTMVFMNELGLRLLGMRQDQCWVAAFKFDMLGMPLEYFLTYAKPIRGPENGT